MNSRVVLNQQLLPLIREMIQNACVNEGSPESGNEIRSASTLERFFSAYGIECEILSPIPNRANLLVRIPGRDPMAPSLMFMGHMDVVPANSERWSVDPFAAEVHDDYLYGRGTLDMLNITASAAVGLAEYVKENGRGEGDLLYLALADEEAMGNYGARWLVENHWSKVQTDYMVTELGGFFVDTAAGPAATVTIGEKGLAWTRVSLSGTAGHGSLPYGTKNAAEAVSRALLSIYRKKSKRYTGSEYLRMADSFASSPFERFLLHHRATLDWGIKRVARRDMGAARFLHAASRMTMSANVVQAGNKVNVIADQGEFQVDVRLLPGQGVEQVQRNLSKAVEKEDPEAQIEFLDFFPANLSDQNTPLMKAIRSLTRQAFEGCELVPLYIGGVTDGRFWRQRGTVVYGFTHYDKEMSMSAYAAGLHGVDERVSLGSLEHSLRFFYQLPEAFSKAVAGK
ncbi:MAG: M20/M25/M40 family metallo-hydrolase [Spirochaetales bacterium]|nr:M20/M25/M40 family metallo-hydrolase [Spirochaetales bacterium]MCF7936986.1 M20/M25/M40 family metallo-hydrolase [Spirochaetales bacterium]